MPLINLGDEIADNKKKLDDLYQASNPNSLKFYDGVRLAFPGWPDSSLTQLMPKFEMDLYNAGKDIRNQIEASKTLPGPTLPPPPEDSGFTKYLPYLGIAAVGLFLFMRKRSG